MIAVKHEMPKLEEVCEIKLVNGEEYLAMRVEEEGKEYWWNDLHDVIFEDVEVEAWKYFFPN